MYSAKQSINNQEDTKIPKEQMKKEIDRMNHKIKPLHQQYALQGRRCRPLPMHDQAAQFAPFSALAGYDDAVAETARLTEARPELDEQEQWAINERLAYIADHIHEQPEVKIQYFVPDGRKSGGAIVKVSGKVKKISATDGTIVMADGCIISITDVIEVSV